MRPSFLLFLFFAEIFLFLNRISLFVLSCGRSCLFGSVAAFLPTIVSQMTGFIFHDVDYGIYIKNNRIKRRIKRI